MRKADPSTARLWRFAQDDSCIKLSADIDIAEILPPVGRQNDGALRGRGWLVGDFYVADF